MGWYSRAALAVVAGSFFASACSGSYSGVGLTETSPDGGNGNDAGPIAPQPGAACDAATAPACAGDDLVTCNAGQIARTTCPLGCTSVGCQHLDSTTSADSVDIGGATADSTFASGDTIQLNTDTGKITRILASGSSEVLRDGGNGAIGGITWSAVSQNAGGAPQLGVFGFASFTLGAGTTLTVTGRSALVIVTTTGTNILGTLVVRPDCAASRTSHGVSIGAALATSGSLFNVVATNGMPGSGTVGTVDTGSPNLCSGAGGGANSTIGTNGQRMRVSASRNPDPGRRGDARSGTIFDTPIIAGGASGGSPVSAVVGPQSETTIGGVGGLGGGAVALLSDGPVVVAGTIDAGGCGGTLAPSEAASPSCVAAGGGGAGGTVFFEAATVTIRSDARILANGGGGGGGTPSVEAYRATGADASSTDTTPAPGGRAGGSSSAGACDGGGNGSPTTSTPGTCAITSGVAVSGRGSGGGGGAGVVAARTRTGDITTEAGAIISPGFITANVAVK